MIFIPKQLQRGEIRFCKILKRTKKPFENDWQQTQNYSWDDSLLQIWLQQDNNYGCIGGFGDLRIIDCDNKNFAQTILKIIGNTFTVMTGNGGTHFYIKSDYDKNHVFKDGVGELRGNKYQVVGPNCIHPNGNTYQVINNSEIKFIPKDELKKILEPYLRTEVPTTEFDLNKAKDESRSGLEYRKIIALLKEGKSKDDIFKIMIAYSKWATAPQQYRDYTYNKAFAFVKNEIKITEKPSKKKIDERKEDKKKDNSKHLSLYVDKNIMIEQILIDKVSKFCIYNFDTKEIKIEDSYYLQSCDWLLLPLEGEEIDKGAIFLPSNATEYENDEKLDEDIKNFILKWLDIPEDMLQFALWNIKRSWVFERFHTLNYLRALGDTGMGKTRFLDVLGYLHYKPISTSGATTSAPIFRIIDKWRGTLIFDEADFAKTDENQDIIKIINQGYERGKFIMRCDKENNNQVNFFDPFCPKILATRNPFQDKATESRCITQVMEGTEKKEIPLNLNKEFFEEALKLRNKLLMWRFNNYFKIEPDKIVDFDLGELESRIKQIVTSFVSLFSNDNKQLELFKQFITRHQEEIIEERKNSFAGAVVGGIWELINDKQLDINAQDIIDKAKLTDMKGNILKPRGLSSILRSLGFKKTEIKKVDKMTKRCIPLSPLHLTKIFKRYGYEVTVVTIVKGISLIVTELNSTLDFNPEVEEINL